MTAIILLLLWLFFTYITYDIFLEARVYFGIAETKKLDIGFLFLCFIGWPILLTMLAVAFVIDTLTDE